jgi:hypothetical protein
MQLYSPKPAQLRLVFPMPWLREFAHNPIENQTIFRNESWPAAGIERNSL